MLELRDLTLLNPGSRIFVSGPGEPGRFVGGDMCLTGIGGDSSLMLESLEKVPGFHGVNLQSDDIWMLV